MGMVPVIFLTALNSDEDRILGFRLGADDYLAKPFRFEELDLRVDRVLRTIDRIHSRVEKDLAAADPEGLGLRGDLAHLGVSALLTILEMERKSGILVLKTRKTGRVFLRDGRVLAAFVDGKETLECIGKAVCLQCGQACMVSGTTRVDAVPLFGCSSLLGMVAVQAAVRPLSQ